jgi:hypothetical protein
LEIYKIKSILSYSEEEQSNYFQYCKYTRKLEIGYDDDRQLKSQSRYEEYKAKEEAKKQKGEKADQEESDKDDEQIDLAGGSKFDMQEFKCFLSYLPKLRSINLRESSYFSFYLTCLSDLDNTQ